MIPGKIEFEDRVHDKPYLKKKKMDFPEAFFFLHPESCFMYHAVLFCRL